MSSALDDLNALVDDLEDEGHSLAGRARDVATAIRDTYEDIDGKDELEQLAQRLAAALAPELNKLKADTIKQAVTAVGKARNMQIHITPGPGAGRAY